MIHAPLTNGFFMSARVFIGPRRARSKLNVANRDALAALDFGLWTAADFGLDF
jgi:hypothetical protein